MKRSVRRLALSLIATSVLILGLRISPSGAVVNGQPDNGRHPYVALVATGGYPDYPADFHNLCTGTLIAPTVVLTAAHCTEIPTPDGSALETATSARVWFDEGPDFPGFPAGGGDAITATAIIPNPDFCPGIVATLPCSLEQGGGKGPGAKPLQDTRDLALIKLSKPVTGVGTLPLLPSYGMASTLPAHADLALVGYGWHSHTQFSGLSPCDASNNYCQGQPQERTAGTVQLIQDDPVWSDEFLTVTGNPGQGDASVGDNDSGAPLLYTDPTTGTVYQVGVISLMTSAVIGPGNGIAEPTRLDTFALAWIDSYLTP